METQEEVLQLQLIQQFNYQNSLKNYYLLQGALCTLFLQLIYMITLKYNIRTLMLLFVLYSGTTYSQNIDYIVTSVNDYKPIINAEICFSNNIDTICYKSDINGKINVNLLKKGVYIMNIIKDGYEPYKETIEVDNTNKIFYLWKNSTELDEVVISVRRTNLNRNLGTTTLKVDDSAFFQNASFEDIVRIIPEVSMNNDKINILGKNRVLYLINGRETNRNINQLQANQIDKIEVISNPSAKYQANYDAVINIILKRNENRGLYLNLNSNTSINRKNSYQNSIDLGLNLGKLNIESNFKYNFNNGLVYDNGWQDYDDKFENYDKKYNTKKEYIETSTNVNYTLNSHNDIGTNFTFGRTPKTSIYQKLKANFMI